MNLNANFGYSLLYGHLKVWAPQGVGTSRCGHFKVWALQDVSLIVHKP